MWEDVGHCTLVNNLEFAFFSCMNCLINKVTWCSCTQYLHKNWNIYITFMCIVHRNNSTSLTILLYHLTCPMTINRFLLIQGA